MAKKLVFLDPSIATELLIEPSMMKKFRMDIHSISPVLEEKQDTQIYIDEALKNTKLDNIKLPEIKRNAKLKNVNPRYMNTRYMDTQPSIQTPLISEKGTIGNPKYASTSRSPILKSESLISELKAFSHTKTPKLVIKNDKQMLR